MVEQSSRTPQGVRGLKLNIMPSQSVKSVSHSARSAWIETLKTRNLNSISLVALRKECVD